MLIKWPYKRLGQKHWFFKYIGGPLFAVFTFATIAIIIFATGYVAYDIASRSKAPTLEELCADTSSPYLPDPNTGGFELKADVCPEVR